LEVLTHVIMGAELAPIFARTARQRRRQVRIAGHRQRVRAAADSDDYEIQKRWGRQRVADP
jgi:hypothetical protein